MASPTTVRARAVRRQRLRRIPLHVGTLVALVALWWLVTRLGLVRPLFLPPPGDVWDAFVRANTDHPLSPGSDRIVRGEQNYYLWEHLLASLQRIGLGVGAAVVVGIPVGLVMATTWLGVVLEPYLSFLRALPPLAYIGLLIVWFGIGDTSKVWLLFLAAFPPIAMATISGVRGVREDMVNAVLSLGASRRQTLTAVMIPATLPEILTGVRVAVGFAWTTVVAAEIANGIPGIGALAYLSGQKLNSDLVVACILVIGLAAIALDLGLKFLEKVLVPWRGKA
ncbi:ABC transporter permease [Nocardioides lianchengensis]|uniref:Taurine transport system permease protein n=1 Tax=Nocardioides lianchengensis TaxID=1045774 RepID=A0A1G6IQS9_9ACTN|nr:ABC transporter permease subunit [Nocardioides lianchengensis]NYG12971.1 taurine transport system permease protein [Nocardioides lianchengensis]SDC08790.1 taurine transport system permease protein [Nocardioides lianchengensis]